MVRVLVIALAFAVVIPQTPREAATDAVYSTLLPQEWPIREAHAQQAVTLSTTILNRTCIPPSTLLHAEWKAVLEDYERENETPKRVTDKLRLGVPYVLADRDAVEGLFKREGVGGGWNRYNTMYPKSQGFMEVSAVGFNADFTRAIVYVAHHCGGLCGGGTNHFMEKMDDRWRPAKLEGWACAGWIS